MKKIKIGIPRTNMYYKYGVFWKHFFLCLNCKIILSPETNNEILTIGSNNLLNNNCINNKKYFGHIKKLINSCDYILIYKECLNFPSCIYYKQFIENLKIHLSSSQILFFNPNKNKIKEITKIALKLTKNPIRIIYAYLYAYDKQKNYNINKENNQKNKLNNNENKVLIVNSENNIYKEEILNYLENNKITPIFSNNLSKKESLFFTKHINDLYINKEIKEYLGSIYYYQYSIKAIIYLNNTNCILDNYIYTFIKNEIKNISTINIDNNNLINIETKLELLIETINNIQNK